MLFAVTYTPSYPTDLPIVDTVNIIIGLMQTVGVIVGIIMIFWAGFKYLTKGAGGKADAKETLVPIVIGAAIIMLAPTIASVIFKAFQVS